MGGKHIRHAGITRTGGVKICRDHTSSKGKGKLEKKKISFST